MSEINSESSAKSGRRWGVLLPALVMPLAASFFYFVLFPGTAFGNAFYTGIKFFLLLWPLIAVKVILRDPLIDRFREKRHRASIIEGTIFGLVVVGLLVFLIEATPLGAVVFDNTDRIAERIEDLGVREHYLWFAIFISFAHAALEEFYWRWFAFGQARKLMPAGVAGVVAALGFASHHVVILSQFFPLGWAAFLGACVGIGGGVWSLTYHRTGSLWGAWVSHMIIDLGIMWVGWEVLQRSTG